MGSNLTTMPIPIPEPADWATTDFRIAKDASRSRRNACAEAKSAFFQASTRMRSASAPRSHWTASCQLPRDRRHCAGSTAPCPRNCPQVRRSSTSATRAVNIARWRRGGAAEEGPAAAGQARPAPGALLRGPLGRRRGPRMTPGTSENNRVSPETKNPYFLEDYVFRHFSPPPTTNSSKFMQSRKFDKVS